MLNLFRVHAALLAAPWMALVPLTASPAAKPAKSLVPDVRTFAIAAASNCTYYNNAQHSQVVGQFGKDCCNNVVAWGHKTSFSVCGGCFPCIPPPP